MREKDYNDTRGAAIERATDAKIEKHFRSHPELPVGRNFHTWNHDRDSDGDSLYRNNFDNIFPNSPGVGI